MSWAREVQRQKNKTPVNFSMIDSYDNYKPAILSTLSTVRARRFSRVRFVCLETFGYADRIQKYSCLLSIDDTSSQKLRQNTRLFFAGIGLADAVTKHHRYSRNFKLIDVQDLHACGEKEDSKDDY